MPPFSPYGAGPPFLPAQPPSRPPGGGNDGRAVAALVLGILSVTCLGVGFLAGIPAIVLGAVARKDIERWQGARSGKGLAAAGIVTGLFGTGLSLVVLLVLLGGAVESMRADEPQRASQRSVPVGAAGTRSYGSLDVVDIVPAKETLRAQLVAIAESAATKSHIVIVQTYARSSRECADVAAALADKRVQRALANVTLVRVDIEAFGPELDSMRVETESAPWFYRLDRHAIPTDAISADEWDENVPENIAPILSEFARGTFGSRRSPSPIGTAL